MNYYRRRARAQEGENVETVRAQRPLVTVIVPTLREVENLPHLIQRLSAVSRSSGLDIELFLMDDNSRDGTVELVESLHAEWVHVFVRTKDPGLSRAVLDGMRRSKREVLIVMDADLSHPPEKIPEMIDVLSQGADMVVGSRFVEGGSTDDEWGVFRWLNSRVATLLAMPLTRLKDPMSGFFALRRSTFAAGRDFNPVGYKIALEILVKCRCQHVVEIPIHFTDRRLGTSKLSLNEQLRYLKHIWRLYSYKYPAWSHLAQFFVVGLSGAVINLSLLTTFLVWSIATNLAIALSIGLSSAWNFVLYRRFSFSYAKSPSVFWQFAGFAGACSVGAVVNFFATEATWPFFQYKQIATILGIVAGTTFNFLASRFVVFRQTYIKPPQTETAVANDSKRMSASA